MNLEEGFNENIIKSPQEQEQGQEQKEGMIQDVGDQDPGIGDILTPDQIRSYREILKKKIQIARGKKTYNIESQEERMAKIEKIKNLLQ